MLDAFQTANELIEVSELAVPRFDLRIVGVRRTVRTAQGFSVPVHAPGPRSPDCVVVPAIGFKMPGPLEIALARPDVRDAAIIAATVVPARRDDDRRLHWYVRDGRIRSSRPAACDDDLVAGAAVPQAISRVLLDEVDMIVKSGRVVTAGAALSHMDLALWLIRSVSPQLASLTANT